MISFKTIYEEVKQSKYKIYLDVDGVLADFDRQFKNLTGLLPKEFESKYGTEKFWEVIPKNNTSFWKEIPWMSDGKELFSYVKKYNPTLLTAPSRHYTSKQGKREWRDEQLPGTKLILKGAKFKHEYARHDSILVDDRVDNIERWNTAGGVGILHTSTSNTINQLKKLGL